MAPTTQSRQTERAAPAPALKEREIAVLRALGQGDETQVAFQGLKRRLALHQEALRRTLRSLTRSGLIAKREHGYGLTEKGHGVVEAHALPVKTRRRALPAAHLLLPTNLPVEAVVEALSGRWFDGLRWYGIQQGPGEFSLLWESPTKGHQVRVRMGIGTATIELVGGTEADLKDVGALMTPLVDMLRSSDQHDSAIDPLAAAGPGYAA
jgi:DNA-binding MarR family transcriptional regulator